MVLMSLSFFPCKLDRLDNVVRRPIASSWRGGQKRENPPSLTYAAVETPDSQGPPGKQAQVRHSSDELASPGAQPEQ